jgi:Tfp pilus assembly protein PilN
MIRINLLPIKQLQAEITRRREIMIGSVVLGAAVLLIVGLHIYQAYYLSSLEAQLAALRAELQILNSRVKEVSDLQVKIKDLRSKQTIIEDLARKKSGPVLVMASLSRATPASLWLTELREAGGNVVMNGMAADNETIAQFLRSLGASGHFANIELVESVQGPSAGVKKFSVKARALYRPTPEPAKPAMPQKTGGKKG